MSFTSPVEIIVFSGKMGTGKDYLAQKLHNILQITKPLPTLFMAFADQLKVSVAVEDGVDLGRLYTQKDEETRRLLQKRGTDEGRRDKGEDVWLDYLLTWLQIHASRGISRFIITDARFPNELEGLMGFAQKAGHRFYVFRLEAPRRNSARLKGEFGGDPLRMSLAASHLSETALDEYSWPAGTVFLYNDPGQEKESLRTINAWAWTLARDSLLDF